MQFNYSDLKIVQIFCQHMIKFDQFPSKVFEKYLELKI
jgi:hypothetical protein